MSGSPLVKSKFRRLSPSDITLGGIVHERSMVYEATWSPPDTGETVTVAVKIMETLRENSLDIICSVHHKNILKFYGAMLADSGHPWNGIITEFCGGGILYDLLQDKSREIAFNEKQDWALGIAKGMNYLHESVLSSDRAIRHNNLTSAIVFMKEERGKLVPKIGGFGYAKVYSATGSVHNTKTGAITDFAWQSPERIKGEDCTTKSDVYSFSIILWELHTRKVPYKGTPTYKLITMITSGERPLEKEFTEDQSFPEDWRSLIVECWAQDAENRPTFEDIEYRLKHHTFHGEKPTEGAVPKKNPLLVEHRAVTARGPPWAIEESAITIPPEDTKCPREGRFGSVCLATFNDSRLIALRCLQPQCMPKSDSFPLYMGLVAGISKKCPYLVDIIGGCVCHSPSLHFKIAMERMETSLRDKLEKGGGGVITDYEVYKKIALDAARGLHYLHDLQPPCIHGSLTSGNVLLSVEKCTESTKAAMKSDKIKKEKFVVRSPIEPDSFYLVSAKISDFCCSILHEEIGSVPSIEVYRAPEAGSTKSYSTKEQDVFAYGVLLLEMRLTEDKTRLSSGISRRLNRDAALSSLKSSLPKLDDRTVPPVYFLARNCTNSSREERPNMGVVVDTLAKE